MVPPSRHNENDESDNSDDRRNHRRRSSDQPAPAKTFGLAVVVVGLVGSIFTAGYNWRSVSNIEAAQGDYVRKDVQSEQMKNLQDQVSSLRALVEEVRSELRAQRRKE